MVARLEHAATAVGEDPRAQERPGHTAELASAARRQHPVDIRVTLPALFGRFYLTVVAGRERRNPARRAAERRRHPLLRFGNLVVLAGAGTLLGFAGLALVQLAARAWMQHHGLLD